MEKTSLGISENVAGLLCYLAGWITGFIIILLEKENRFVRFHAMQSIIIFGAITLVTGVLSWIPLLGAILDWLIGIIAFILWIVLMVKAAQGVIYKAPWAGDLAEKWTS